MGGNNIKMNVVDPRSFIKGELSAPEFPTKVRVIKGIRFNPEVILNTGTLYFIVVSVQNPYWPVRGFYDVPNKGFITWIGGWRVVAVSDPLPIGPVKHIAYIFEAVEDDPPKGVIPFKPRLKGTPPGIIF